MGFIATALLGMLGSLIGGFIGAMLSGDRVLDLRAAGLIGSVIGALIVLLLIGAGGRRASV